MTSRRKWGQATEERCVAKRVIFGTKPNAFSAAAALYTRRGAPRKANPPKLERSNQIRLFIYTQNKSLMAYIKRAVITKLIS